MNVAAFAVYRSYYYSTTGGAMFLVLCFSIWVSVRMPFSILFQLNFGLSYSNTFVSSTDNNTMHKLVGYEAKSVGHAHSALYTRTHKMIDIEGKTERVCCLLSRVQFTFARTAQNSQTFAYRLGIATVFGWSDAEDANTCANETRRKEREKKEQEKKLFSIWDFIFLSQLGFRLPLIYDQIYGGNIVTLCIRYWIDHTHYTLHNIPI